MLVVKGCQISGKKKAPAEERRLGLGVSSKEEFPFKGMHHKVWCEERS